MIVTCFALLLPILSERGLLYHLVPFDGRSDYGPFIAEETSIPGVFTDVFSSFYVCWCAPNHTHGPHPWTTPMDHAHPAN